MTTIGNILGLIAAGGLLWIALLALLAAVVVDPAYIMFAVTFAGLAGLLTWSLVRE